MKKLLVLLGFTFSIAMAGTGSSNGQIQTIETDGLSTGTSCSQNHFFVKINNQYYWSDYNDAGRGVLTLALTAYTTGKGIDLIWNDASTLCSQAYKKIDQISFTQ
jgi:hypothetical protein